MHALDQDDDLADFEPREITIDDVTRRVWVGGPGAGAGAGAGAGGPAVIVMTEMPGISPEVARFARWVRDAGFTVWMPSLFGRDGAVPGADEGAAIFRRTCIAATFRAVATGGPGAVTDWLRGLARIAHQACGGPGVGAIGMCFTGNYALSMMLEPAVLAPVLCQPSLPLDAPAAIESPPEELAAVRVRLEREDLTVLAYRFAGDAVCRAERFAAYERALGDRFRPRTLPDTAARREGLSPFFARHVPTPHSVVTAHLIDEAGQPTLAARDEILAFLADRLT